MRSCHCRRGVALCGAALLLSAPATRAAAQEPVRPQELPSVRVESRVRRAIPPVRCNGELITEIVIAPREPFVPELMERWQLVARTVSGLHVTTKPGVLRRFLLLDAGDRCTEIRRAESERVLRAQPFLAAAIVRPIADGPGRVRILVETVDEITTVAGVSATTKSPNVRMLRAGEGNLLGEAIFASAEWRAGTYGRAGYTGRLIDYQLFGRTYQLALEGAREQLGGRWLASLTHPYFSDLQRVAWRVNGGAAHDYFSFRREGDDDVTVGARRVYADIGGLMRVGVPGRLSLFGISFTSEREDVDVIPVHITPDGPVELPLEQHVTDRYRPTRSARVNALWGVRNIAFVPVEGFDALTAIQDVRVGFQAGTLFGRTVPILGSRDDDIFASVDLYAGFGSPTSFVMLNGRGEGRQDYNTNRWDGVLGSARLAWYLRPVSGNTVLTSAEWTGGWRPRVPLQLLVGDADGGVRGYGRSAVGGGRRAVARVESRWYLGRYQQAAEYGVAFFTDAGKTWAGDVPFGEDSPVKVGVGVGVLAALPAGSQRLWRLDIAYPVSADSRARLEVRLGASNIGRRGWREPNDISRSRERTVPEGVFRWP